jgi:hypothetical protein
MTTTEILPSLTLSTDQFEAARAAVSEHAPDLPPLTYERWTRPRSWALVPDQAGEAYKAEMELARDAERMLRVTVWLLPDLRGGEAPKPHSHPWSFRSHILAGGYTEHRYDPATAPAGLSVLEHDAGAVNAIDRVEYHEVVELHEPGTLTLMVCGPGVRGGWGYLDVATGIHLPLEPDPGFSGRFRALNGHLVG